MSNLEEWVPRVYRFALRLSNDPHAAEDLTQETFLRAWRQRERLRDAGAVRVWLFRINESLTSVFVVQVLPKEAKPAGPRR